MPDLNSRLRQWKVRKWLPMAGGTGLLRHGPDRHAAYGLSDKHDEKEAAMFRIKVK